MNYDEKKLKLIYIKKIGYNTKDEGLYEFIFSLDPENIDVEGWCWDLNPACDNAMPPTEDYIEAILNLKTSSFDMFCLHEAVDREYMHGYHTIHALAFETEREEDDFSDYDSMFGSILPDFLSFFANFLASSFSCCLCTSIGTKGTCSGNSESLDLESSKLRFILILSLSEAASKLISNSSLIYKYL